MPGAGGTAQRTAHSPAERAARPPRRPLGQPACSPQHSQSQPGTQVTTQTPPGVNQNQFRPIQSLNPGSAVLQMGKLRPTELGR